MAAENVEQTSGQRTRPSSLRGVETEAEITDWLQRLFASRGHPNVKVTLKKMASREVGFPAARRTRARLYRAEVHILEDTDLGKAVEDATREELPAAGGIAGASPSSTPCRSPRAATPPDRRAASERPSILSPTLEWYVVFSLRRSGFGHLRNDTAGGSRLRRVRST